MICQVEVIMVNKYVNYTGFDQPIDQDKPCRVFGKPSRGLSTVLG